MAWSWSAGGGPGGRGGYTVPWAGGAWAAGTLAMAWAWAWGWGCVCGACGGGGGGGGGVELLADAPGAMAGTGGVPPVAILLDPCRFCA